MRAALDCRRGWRSPWAWAAWLALSVLVAGVLGSARHATVTSADSASVVRWEKVGHIADGPISWLAVPPDGLTSGVFFAHTVDAKNGVVLNDQAGGGSTRRSRDGGKTWEQVPDPPGHVVLPPGGSPAFSLTKDTVYRSSDAGQSWSAVASMAANTFLFSPGYAQDGTAFLFGNDQLWRSTDRGLTWSNLDPGGGQLVAGVRLSPSFAADHTLFVGAVSGRPTLRGGNPPPTDNADSLGLLISRDTGATWTPLSDGLQINGDPYRQILDLEVSPDFATDQTLFVSSLGPWQSAPEGTCSACVPPPVGVFRTQDAGTSWDLVDQRTLRVVAVDGTLRLSPAFSTDQTLFSSLSVTGAAPSQSGCAFSASSDGGDSWQPSNPPSLSAGLCGVGIVRATSSTILLAYQPPYYLSSEANRDIFHSLDGGGSWTLLAPPGDGLVLGFQADLAERQVVLPDRILQATQKGDVWEYGAFPPCSIQPILGFGQVGEQYSAWQDAAGCPIAPEQPVAIQMQQKEISGLGATDEYWTANGSECVRVYHDYLGALLGRAAPQSECGGTSVQQFSGAILRFANDQFWLYVKAPGHGLVVNSMGGVVELDE